MLRLRMRRRRRHPQPNLHRLSPSALLHTSPHSQSSSRIYQELAAPPNLVPTLSVTPAAPSATPCRCRHRLCQCSRQPRRLQGAFGAFQALHQPDLPAELPSHIADQRIRRQHEGHRPAAARLRELSHSRRSACGSRCHRNKAPKGGPQAPTATTTHCGRHEEDQGRHNDWHQEGGRHAEGWRHQGGQGD